MPLPAIAAAGIFGTTIRAVFASTFAVLFIKIIGLIGLTFVTYQGVDLGVSQLQSIIISYFNDMPSDVIQLLGLSGVDQFITLILSAWIASFTVRGISGSLRKMVFR